jgi:hypothetical protein
MPFFAWCDNRLSPVFGILAGIMILIDERTQDGSRRFACLPEEATWDQVRNHAALLPNAEIVNSVSGEHAKAWLDFRFRQHRFLIKTGDGRVHLFVHDPQCCDLILYEVGRHFEQLLADDDDDA